MSRDKLWPEYEGDNQNVKDVAGKFNVEDVYVEVLEGELDRQMDAAFEKDLEIWLSRSETSSAHSLEELEKLSQIRQGLKNADDVALPESGVYFDALEARIMGALDAAIDAGEVESREVSLNQNVVTEMGSSASEIFLGAMKARRRQMIVRAGQFAVLAGVTLLMTGKWLVAPEASGKTGSQASASNQSAASVLRATHKAAPAVLTGTVMSFESNADLALEIAARRLVAYHKGE